jgi:hypothetical protein
MTRNVSTTAVIALFLIISGSGVLLLLHAGGQGIKAVHEWLGLAFVLFGVLHSAANSPLMKGYLLGMKGAIIAVAVIATLGLSGLGSSESQAPPIKAVFTTLQQAPLTNIARLYDREPEALADQLRAKGYAVAGTDRSLETIARDNGTRADELLALVATEPGGDSR